MIVDGVSNICQMDVVNGLSPQRKVMARHLSPLPGGKNLEAKLRTQATHLFRKNPLSLKATESEKQLLACCDKGIRAYQEWLMTTVLKRMPSAQVRFDDEEWTNKFLEEFPSKNRSFFQRFSTFYSLPHFYSPPLKIMFSVSVSSIDSRSCFFSWCRFLLSQQFQVYVPKLMARYEFRVREFDLLFVIVVAMSHI